ncbi:hypothetical protein WK29_13715 [Burkholderia vietnamiensis]|nr:hypothetical protein WJ10_26775 [Burkholderia vietnamiensis]KVS16589.1 hypothetical protein WK29_13715 [Burkholderia vietnamiensis]
MRPARTPAAQGSRADRGRAGRDGAAPRGGCWPPASKPAGLATTVERFPAALLAPNATAGRRTIGRPW